VLQVLTGKHEHGKPFHQVTSPCGVCGETWGTIMKRPLVTILLFRYDVMFTLPPPGPKKEKECINEYSPVVSHPSTNSSTCCLTSEIRRDQVLSTVYERIQGWSSILINSIILPTRPALLVFAPLPSLFSAHRRAPQRTQALIFC
jgi:hypothetical protein